MKNIVVFVKNLESGGAEKQSVLLAKSLSANYNIHYLIFNDKYIEQKYIYLLKEDEKIIINFFSGNIIIRFFYLCKYFRKNKIEVIFSYLTGANAIAIFAGIITNVKFIYSGIRTVYLPTLKLLVDKLITNYLATGTIVNCYSGKYYFKSKGFIPEKLKVITNCFENIVPYTEKACNEDIKIITVGRFVPQKDYDTALKTISLLKNKYTNIKFQIVGYGILEDHIRELIRSFDLTNNVELYINPNNISELLNLADIYLSTSLFEGTSNSIMEGLNANLPIVATNVGDNDYLVQDKKNGYLTNVQDPFSIADKLEKLILDALLRKNMGKESKIILQEKYSVNIFRNKYIDLIENH